MKKVLSLLLAALWASLFPALAAGSHTFFAMDTAMTVSASGADNALLTACEEEARRLEALFSVTDPASEIARLNETGASPLSPETGELLAFALDMGEKTDGALDITLYPVVRAWGFTTGEYRVPEEDEIAALLENVGWENLALTDGAASLPDGFMADLGAVAKGYASDRMISLLREGGVSSALIDLGGNVACLGSKENGKAWRVGIRDPLNPSDLLGALSVRDAVVITSGSYERFFTGEDGVVYGHIFDPSTGRPADSGLISVTVTGKSGMLADALSTALYVLGAERACRLLAGLEDAAVVMVDGNGALWISEALREAFTPMGAYLSAPIHWIQPDGEAIP